MRGDGFLFRQRGSPFWWMAYHVDGGRRRKSTRQADRRKAERILRQKVAEALVGEDDYLGKPLSLGQLLDFVRADYKAKRRRSLATLKYCLRHLTDFFGEKTPVARITTPKIDQYIAQRREDGAAESSIRSEVHLLSRAFKLAVRARRISERGVPYVPSIPPDPSRVRRGFITFEELGRLCGELDEDHADLVAFLFHSCWRKSEATSLEWRDYDAAVGAFRLRAENSKTSEPRWLPLAGEIFPIIERRVAKRDPDCAYVFHRQAGPNGAKRRVKIGDFRKVWRSACEAVELNGRIVHDLRRSGIKHMAEAGIDQRRIMALSGHKTVSTFHRYQITDLTSLQTALELVSRRARRRRRHETAAAGNPQSPESPRA